MKGDGQRRQRTKLNAVAKVVINITPTHSYNSRGSVAVELLCKAGGTLQTVSGGGTGTALTGRCTGKTEAICWLKVFCTHTRESSVTCDHTRRHIHSSFLSFLSYSSLLPTPSSSHSHLKFKAVILS